MEAINKFIGSGLIFPIELNEHGRPDTVNDIRLIRSSILNIINWPTRIRFFNEKINLSKFHIFEYHFNRNKLSKRFFS